MRCEAHNIMLLSLSIILVQVASLYVHPFQRYHMFSYNKIAMSFLAESVPCFVHRFDRKISVTLAYKPSNISGSVQPFSTEQPPLYTELYVE